MTVTPLSYCTNVHPAEDLDGVLAQLDRYAEPVRRLVGTDVLGLGLWLPAALAAGLADDPALRAKLRTELDARGLEVHTLNAFPYGGFHDEVVKHSVYRPQWTDQRRLEYTLDCATVLADLLPDGARYGSISTLPLAWRTPWDDADDAAAMRALTELTAVLDGMASRDGRPIRLAVEPEPGCVLDSVADAVRWLAPRVDPRYVGLCLDTCHLAVSFADPAETVAEIHRAGLSVVKVQASAALQVEEPASEAAQQALADFTEPRYLHQVRERTEDGVVLGADDLPQARTELPALRTWRVHFHVPLHARPAAPLSATTDVLRAAVAALASTVDELPHVEVETYTWSVLPETAGNGGDTALIRGIAAELRWAAAQLLGQDGGVR
ncbi:metabolite traffic protein EboE [Actinophytocola gossypii]|uniref:Metabolite traffic protein EboE n=1 Tax=Actinophytocola gossypii TaxID=2812003 RepID=A0ABT2JE26_9PSEU|nr:metabolite traffic protein EboE [Actinophytocola gossypii]MCT2586131.1 metabolite traffic protein EboE [Actinophytocola gossypii]